MTQIKQEMDINGDDVIADIIGNYDQDMDMAETGNPPLRAASPVSPTPLPSSISPSRSSPIPPGIHVEPISPQRKSDDNDEKQTTTKDKATDKKSDKKTDKNTEKTNGKASGEKRSEHFDKTDKKDKKEDNKIEEKKNEKRDEKWDKQREKKDETKDKLKDKKHEERDERGEKSDRRRDKKDTRTDDRNNNKNESRNDNKNESRNDNKNESRNDNKKDEKNSEITHEPPEPRYIKLSKSSSRSENEQEDKADNDGHDASFTIKRFRTRSNARSHTQFFVIKSFSENHLKISIEKGIWATQRRNESKLNDAFRRSDVVLIFSVNESRHFQGYAQMTSPIGGYKASGSSNVWVDSKHDDVWGNSFGVKWLQRYDLPFTDTGHLRNPLNDDKPVKISRDCQELAEETAMELCGLIDKGAAKAEKKRKPGGILADDKESKDDRDNKDDRDRRERTKNDQNDGSPENKRVRGDNHPRTHDIHASLPSSRRIVLPPNARHSSMPLYEVGDYSQPPPALYSYGGVRTQQPSRILRAFNDRYVPRSAEKSPPPKRARSRSYSPPARGGAYFRAEFDRKRKDRDDERARDRDFDRDRDRERGRARERDRYGGRERERERGRDGKDNGRDYNPPPDMLNMVPQPLLVLFPPLKNSFRN